MSQPEKTSNTEAAEQDFESGLKALTEIVEQLERGDLPLEKGVTMFREGLQLAAACRKSLEKAKNEVTVLEQGALQEFDADDGGSGAEAGGENG